MKTFWLYVKETFKKWNEENPFRLSAIIAYYAIFSLPALLLIVINIAGTIFGKHTVTEEIYSQINGLMGESTAISVRNIVNEAANIDTSLIGSIFGIVTLLFAATAVFFHLQISLNKFWDVETLPKYGFLELIIKRAVSLGMILVIGLLLLVSLVTTTVLSALSDWVKNLLPSYVIYVFYIFNFITSIGIITILFALILKYLPDVKLRWSTVWKGSMLTALLFVIGKFALSFYFAKTDPATVYGAAGSIIIILLWVYYSSLILFFGAAFTCVYARLKNHPVTPVKYAVKVKTITIKEEKS